MSPTGHRSGAYSPSSVPSSQGCNVPDGSAKIRSGRQKIRSCRQKTGPVGKNFVLTPNIAATYIGRAVGGAAVRGSTGRDASPSCLFLPDLLASGRPIMFVLYIDGSGSVRNPEEKHFVLAGVAMFERTIFHTIRDLDEVVASFNLGHPTDEVELHGSPMLQGRDRHWRSIPRARRVEMMSEALSVLDKAPRNARAFGIVVNKEAISPADPVEYAFEEICNRFNLFLRRNFQSRGGRDEDKQKGLVVMDESNYEQPLQALAREFRIIGTRWGHLRNLAEVPLFVDSRASRIVQLADLLAFSLWRRYEKQDSRFFDQIVHKFDADGGVIHGLVHRKALDERCYCPACMSRQVPATANGP